MLQFSKGCDEVHIIYDSPKDEENTPKKFERSRRDNNSSLSQTHCCQEFSTNTVLPRNWREDILNCHQCKRQLVIFLSKFFLENIATYLHDQQKLIVAGVFNSLMYGALLWEKDHNRIHIIQAIKRKLIPASLATCLKNI